MFPVDAFRSTVGKAVSLFRALEIPFHLTGGITSVYYGEPRMTQDIDIVVGNDRLSAELESFIGLLDSSDFIYDAESISTAVAERGMFQLLDSFESLKLDIYPRELIPGELKRSMMAEVFEGEKLPIASRIDSAVSKLVWISKGSHKSRRDFRQIYRLASPTEQGQVQELVDQLGLKDLMNDVLGESDEIA